jgi:hypothetical protein
LGRLMVHKPAGAKLQNVRPIMTREIKYIVTFIVLIMTMGLTAKPRSVFLDKELKEALITEYVEIMNYTDSTIIFKVIDNNKLLTAKIRRTPTQEQGSEKPSTGVWPLKGNKVLIVVGKNGFVSMFADKQNEFYRFWSPGYTGSTAIFYFKKPALKLGDNNGLNVVKGEYETCWDGCLLPVDKLKTYGRE